MVKGDVIVGADGYDSILRPIVTDAEEPEDSANAVERNLVLTFTLPVGVLNEDEELRTLLTTRDVSLVLRQRVIRPVLISPMLVDHLDGARISPSCKPFCECRLVCVHHLVISQSCSRIMEPKLRQHFCISVDGRGGTAMRDGRRNTLWISTN